MINFTVGPVQSSDVVRKIGAEQVPYFRTPEFSEVMLENEKLMKEFSGAEEKARVIFITGSGTASMEASVINCFSSKDKVLVVNGGSFGHRFVEICQIHEIPYDEICLNFGEQITAAHLKKYENGGYTGFLINVGETSTGVHYDMNLVGDFCRRNNLFLIADNISSFLADPFDMKKIGADIMITGSQKALACPPGISVIVLSENAVNRVNTSNVKSLYFNLKEALKNGERGQTPFTPAVGILLQINARLKEIKNNGGVEKETAKIKSLAEDFRTKISKFPFEFATNSPSNAVTSLKVKSENAYEIFSILKDEYGIWICPNGGDLKNIIFRVGHIGSLSVEENDLLIKAFSELQKNGQL